MESRSGSLFLQRESHSSRVCILQPTSPLPKSSGHRLTNPTWQRRILCPLQSGNDVPFVPYTNGIVHFLRLAVLLVAMPADLGATEQPLRCHQGLDAPWTAKYLNHSLEVFYGYEDGIGSRGGASGYFDGLGWGSLLYRSG